MYNEDLGVAQKDGILTGAICIEGMASNRGLRDIIYFGSSHDDHRGRAVNYCVEEVG